MYIHVQRGFDSVCYSSCLVASPGKTNYTTDVLYLEYTIFTPTPVTTHAYTVSMKSTYVPPILTHTEPPGLSMRNAEYIITHTAVHNVSSNYA